MLYFYDPQGQRVGKQQGNTLEDYVYDPQGHVISVHDGSGTLLRSELYSPQGRHVATWNSNGLFWNHADWLGTERVRTNYNSGQGAEWCTDTPYGMNLACTTPPADLSPMHFTGKQRDSESGLDNFGARYNESTIGRFMTPDPFTLSPLHIINPQRWNMYAYTLNNPTSYTDPTGLDAIAVNFPNQNIGGHEGIISVHANGQAEFADYGPRSKGHPFDEGDVGTLALGTVQFGPDGLPTDASYKSLVAEVAQYKHQDPSTIRLNYFKTSEADTIALDAWIQRLKEASDRGRAPYYDVTRQNCAVFCIVGLIQGGAIQNEGISIIPNDLFDLLSLISTENYSNGQRSPQEVVTTTIINCAGPACPEGPEG